ncbi:MAG: hypothetical protein PHH36_13745 [Sideroxydans sp.]|nr:hypothetical protein [Sideroxydans sp.]
MGLSRLFIGIVLVGTVLVVGFSVFPGFHAIFDEIPLTFEFEGATEDLPPLISALVQFSPYLLLFAIGYGAYIVWRRKR